MHFSTLALIACATFGAAMADVSHLAKHYIPPSPMMQLSKAVKMAINSKSGQSSGERVFTTIEKQELQELPTQIEYLQPGQTPYGFEATNQNVKFTLSLVMPKELIAPPSASLPPKPSMEEQPPTLPPQKQYLAPPVEKRNPFRNNMEMLNDFQLNKQMSSKITHINQAASMTNYRKMHGQQQQNSPSKHYLAPKPQNMEIKNSEEHLRDIPSKQYLAPITTPSHEQELQEQSAPAPQYLPPQPQQPLDMSKNLYMLPQLHKYDMQQQKPYKAPTTYNNRAHKTTSEQQPMLNKLQMQPSRETIGQFGDIENVAEAAQEAIEIFDEELLHPPMTSPNNQKLAYNDEYLLPEYQSAKISPVDFVHQHEQRMMQTHETDVAPMSFVHFQMSSAAPKLQTPSNPVQDKSNGYHYNVIRRFRQ